MYNLSQTALILNIVGLLLDIIGVILLFFFSPPIEGNGISDAVQIQQKGEKDRRSKKISRIALTLILLGFASQFIGNVIQLK